jgi:hypothetical protein
MPKRVIVEILIVIIEILIVIELLKDWLSLMSTLEHDACKGKVVLTLESIRTETETSRGCKSPYVFIEVELLLIFSRDFYIFKMWDLTEVHCSNSRKHKYCEKIKGKCFFFFF